MGELDNWRRGDVQEGGRQVGAGIEHDRRVTQSHNVARIVRIR